MDIYFLGLFKQITYYINKWVELQKLSWYTAYSNQGKSSGMCPIPDLQCSVLKQRLFALVGKRQWCIININQLIAGPRLWLKFWTGNLNIEISLSSFAHYQWAFSHNEATNYCLTMSCFSSLGWIVPFSQDMKTSRLSSSKAGIHISISFQCNHSPPLDLTSCECPDILLCPLPE